MLGSVYDQPANGDGALPARGPSGGVGVNE